MSPLGGEVWAPAGSATITSSLLCLKITLYKTNSPSYHHLWQPSCLPYCWPCRHRNCHWFLSGRCAGQRVMWHTIEVGSPGQRPPSAAPHGAFLSSPPPTPHLHPHPFLLIFPSKQHLHTEHSTLCIFTRFCRYSRAPADIFERKVLQRA